MKITIFLILTFLTCTIGAIDKGVLFVNPSSAPLTKVSSLERMEVLSNLHVPKGVVVGILSDNFSFVVNLYEAIYKINASNHLIVRANGYFQNIDMIAVGAGRFEASLRQAISERIQNDDALMHFKFVAGNINGDRWMQDWGEFVGMGQTAEGEWSYGLYSVNRGRGLEQIVKTLAIILDIPFITSDSTSGSCGNYGGNLESTPDGVTFHGNTMSSAQINQLRRLNPDGKFVTLSTSWLSVGHVDEMFSVIPSNHLAQYPDDYLGPRINYSFVVADPMLGLETIYNYQGDQTFIANGSDRYYFDKLRPVIKYMLYENGTMAKCRTQFADSYCHFVDFNMKIYNKHILPNINALAQTTPNLDDDFIHVPQLYDGTGSCASFLPGTANMLVLRDHLIVPDPTFDGFAVVIKELLNAKLDGGDQDNKVHFVMDKAEYHNLMGEIHCGTNVMREFNRIIGLEEVIGMEGIERVRIKNNSYKIHLQENALELRVLVENSAPLEHDIEFDITASFAGQKLVKKSIIKVDENQSREICFRFENIDWSLAVPYGTKYQISISRDGIGIMDQINTYIRLSQQDIIAYYINLISNPDGLPAGLSFEEVQKNLVEQIEIIENSYRINLQNNQLEMQLKTKVSPEIAQEFDITFSAFFANKVVAMVKASGEIIDLVINDIDWFSVIESDTALEVGIEVRINGLPIETQRISIVPNDNDVIRYYANISSGQILKPESVDQEVLLNYVKNLLKKEKYGIEINYSKIEFSSSRLWLWPVTDIPSKVFTELGINLKVLAGDQILKQTSELNSSLSIGNIDWFEKIVAGNDFVFDIVMSVGDVILAQEQYSIAPTKNRSKDLIEYYSLLITDNIQLPDGVDRQQRLIATRNILKDLNFAETKRGKKAIDSYTKCPEETIIGKLVALKKRLRLTPALTEEFDQMAKLLTPARKNLEQFLFWGKKVSYDKLLRELANKK